MKARRDCPSLSLGVVGFPIAVFSALAFVHGLTQQVFDLCIDAALQLQLKLLIEAHKLNRVVLIVHQDCGFYRERLALVGPEAMQQQIKDLRTAAKSISRMTGKLHIDAYFAVLHHDHVAFAPIEL